MKRKIWIDSRGSAIVEAAIVLPIFIIAVVTMCWLIKLCFLQTTVFSAAAEQVKQNSVSIFGDIGRLGLASGVRSMLEKEGVSSAGFEEKLSVFDASKAGMSNLHRFKFSYDSKISIPAPIIKNVNLDNQITYRMWEGEKHTRKPMGFGNMESGGRGRPVWIFPRAGEKYHREHCRYVKSYCEKVPLSDQIRKKYDRCPLCTGKNERNGQTVYIFKYGSAYHKSECNAVKKLVLCIDEKDALEKGYTPCSVCGG